MTTTASTARRRLRYESLDELLADAERIAAGDHETTGQWSYAQILNHLTATMNASFDGYGFRAPWLVRILLAPLLKRRFLTREMKAGFRLPRRASVLMPEESDDVPAALEALRRALARFERETPTADHPFFGRLSPEEWRLLHQRHAELHMSFVRPR